MKRRQKEAESKTAGVKKEFAETYVDKVAAIPLKSFFFVADDSLGATTLGMTSLSITTPSIIGLIVTLYRVSIYCVSIC
jgi:hypothetical protein